MSPPPRSAATRPVGALVPGPALVCPPHTSVRVAAQAMAQQHARCVAVPLADGTWGVFTDGDLRRRVVAPGVDTATTLAEHCTHPARTVDADRPAADALADLLDAGLRQLLVLDAAGALLGVVAETDLDATPTRAGFRLRAELARAADVEALVALAPRVPALVVAMADARVSPVDVGAVHSIVVDAVVRRALDLVTAGGGHPPCSWLTLGSGARRESVPSSDVESAVVVAPDGEVGAATALGREVHAVLARCGLAADAHQALASQRRFARTPEGWARALDGWVAQPDADQGLVMVSLLADSVVTWGAPVTSWGAPAGLADLVAERVAREPGVLVALLREATQERPGAPRRDRLFRRPDTVDLKAAVLAPVTGIARWAGLAAGSAERTTPGRLDAGVAAGLLEGEDAALLAESFDTVARVRLHHQCDQLRAGRPPDDVVSVAALTPVARSLLDAAVREVAGVRRALAYLASRDSPVRLDP